MCRWRVLHRQCPRGLDALDRCNQEVATRLTFGPCNAAPHVRAKIARGVVLKLNDDSTSERLDNGPNETFESLALHVLDNADPGAHGDIQVSEVIGTWLRSGLPWWTISTVSGDVVNDVRLLAASSIQSTCPLSL